ncbi:hypothetical protein WNY63_02915 [Pseudoalteromonas neustonica]|uniref:Uncharacterized protein n=2 Tax=Pseudoalteromonas TaxID=53246 RepID=A0ABU9TZF9_9GAMM|nr:hypothetical protein [Pseudoalteromonas porphyrae]
MMPAFLSSQLPQLKHLKVRQRQDIIAIALSMLSPMQKISLRIAKLTLLIPLFFSLVYIDGWLMILALIVTGISYPILTTPVEIQFSKPFLAEAIKLYNKEKQGEQ